VRPRHRNRKKALGPGAGEGSSSGPVRVAFVLAQLVSALVFRRQAFPGTTGFDMVGSWGWWRVEVPGGLVKHPGNHKCGLSRVRPRRLVNS
jgi:hypothetical protein